MLGAKCSRINFYNPTQQAQQNNFMYLGPKNYQRPNPPTPPNVKINYDVAMGVGDSYVAAVCRNHKSEIVGVWSDFCDSTDPLIAEARVALLAVKSMKEAGYKSVCFERDSLIVSQAIQGRDVPSTFLVN